MDSLRAYRYLITDENIRPEIAAQLVVADSLDRIARALRDLGNADAGTPMGAIEAFGKQFKESIQLLSEEIAEALKIALA